MAIRQNYFAFTLDPILQLKATEAERKKHLYVLAQHKDNILKYAWQIIQVLFAQ